MKIRKTTQSLPGPTYQEVLLRPLWLHHVTLRSHIRWNTNSYQQLKLQYIFDFTKSWVSFMISFNPLFVQKILIEVHTATSDNSTFKAPKGKGRYCENIWLIVYLNGEEAGTVPQKKQLKHDLEISCKILQKTLHAL